MSVINTNITSMIGQSNLNKSQNALQTSMERLSSGLRINSANRMTAQINGLAQAQNGTNSENDLASIQEEIDQRLTEINRISEQTDFNDVKVLDTDNPLRIQVGANDGEFIEVNLQTINTTTLEIADFTDGFGARDDSAGSYTTEESSLEQLVGAMGEGDVTYTKLEDGSFSTVDGTATAAELEAALTDGSTEYAVGAGWGPLLKLSMSWKMATSLTTRAKPCMLMAVPTRMAR